MTDRVVPTLACNNLTAALTSQAASLPFQKVREAVVLLVQFSVISAQDKSVLEVVFNSEMEHYLSFLLYFCSVPLLLSAQCLVLRHIPLARGAGITGCLLPAWIWCPVSLSLQESKQKNWRLACRKCCCKTFGKRSSARLFFVLILEKC